MDEDGGVIGLTLIGWSAVVWIVFVWFSVD